MKSLPVRSDTLADKPKYVVLQGGFPPSFPLEIFSLHTVRYDAVHNARVIGGVVRSIQEVEKALGAEFLWRANLCGR